jgi:hypothetical protein
LQHHFTSARLTDGKPSDKTVEDPSGLKFNTPMNRVVPGWRKKLDLKHIPSRLWLSVWELKEGS